MTAIEIARRMAQLGETKEALRAYSLALNEDIAPEELLEAAVYTLNNEGDYKLAYTTFVQLYRAGYFREEVLSLMTGAFYEPNVKMLKGRYARNVKLLKKYPYIFRKDFPAFENLPISFFPYDDRGDYMPFDTQSGEFRDFVSVRDPVISRNFFKDLEKPVLASDVYSQYELEYLNDNVRPSEWIGRENHIYLHYTDWAEFCSWLQVLNVKPLTDSEKVVFLIGDELTQYPIDFKKRFGKDYSKYTPRPVHYSEVTKLIWHTQLMAHNGGDFFNEIFDSHPNLLWLDSVQFKNLEDAIAKMREDPSYQIGGITDKDLIVNFYLNLSEKNRSLDPAARITPALFFQPHFLDSECDMTGDGDGRVALVNNMIDALHNSTILTDFKYIKTFTPMRRPTASHSATVRFMWRQHDGTIAPVKGDKLSVIPDMIYERVVNRSYLRDPEDRLYHDSIIVRFEDGKLNPTATFTALAAFLDIPYTESMTYGSLNGNRDPYNMGERYEKGFGTWSIDQPDEKFANDAERYFIEYFLRDVYRTYGYDFKWYDGAPVDEQKVAELINGFTTMDGYIRETWRRFLRIDLANAKLESDADGFEALVESITEEHMKEFNELRMRTARLLLSEPRFVNMRGQPLAPIPLLQLDPALMERELYH